MARVSDDASAQPAPALLRDAFGRIREHVSDLTRNLDPETAMFRPDPEANTITWLIWHLTRVEDDHIADLAGTEQVWTRWRDRFDLHVASDATGFGMSVADVARVQAPASLLDGYHAEVHAATMAYLDELDDAELARVVDKRWDPPVTAGARLVSVYEDATMHLGQAAYVRGVAQRSRDA